MNKNKVGIRIDADTSYKFEKLLRDGLVASGALSEADNENFTLTTTGRVQIHLDQETAAKFSMLLRDGLVASGAVSEADNENFTISVEK